MDAKLFVVNGRLASACFNPRARDGRETFRWVRYGRINGFNPRARDGRE